MRLRQYLGVVLGLSLLAGVAVAGPEDTIRAKLKAAMPDEAVSTIKASPMPGFYEVTLKGYEPIYVSADGRFLFQGEVMEIRGNDLVNLADESMAGTRKTALAAVKRQDEIIFPAAGNKPKAAVYVFTDVDCGYCRKLHSEIGQLSQMGIEVRYLAFPRTGPKSPIAARMDKIWCAADRNNALTDAKKGQNTLPPQKAGCKSPVAEQYALGVELGVKGTPAVFTEDGTQLGGYMPPEAFAKRLKLK